MGHILALSVLLLSAVAVAAGDISSSLRGTDNYKKYKEVFDRASEKLIDDGVCTEADFISVGGWAKSQSFNSKPVYFTYCGGMTLKNRIYLDVSTGNTFR
ncbi:hypothetical protein [Rhizobium rhizogenes]|uniref:hypothetical protein n=1 Tax=Rhizobium rhizogenes TaxID=359 RepID=UPI001571B028|nr:hypothetical protein [Rhizobium rhizogenes]NTF64977.1 hypothetical protein [Rhizobium rhizogenes]NTG96325.1 hypothetical protein [Rhizobium rhizogenes]